MSGTIRDIQSASKRRSPQAAAPLTPASSAPPIADLELEADLLAQVLDVNHPDVWDRIADITRGKHFFADFNRLVWETICELSNEREDGLPKPDQQLTPALVSSVMHVRGQLGPDEKHRLFDLIELRVRQSHAAELMAVRLRELWRQREIADRCARVAAECHGDVGPIQAYLEAFESEVAELARIDTANSSIQLGNSMREALQAHQSVLDGSGPQALLYPLQALNEQLIGMHDSELVIVAGRPGMGKSALMMQTAVEVARTTHADGRQNGVVIFTLEMSHQALSTRTMCSYGRVNMEDYRRGSVSPKGWNDMVTAASWLDKVPVEIVDMSAPTPHQIRSKCKRLKAKFEKAKQRLSLVVVDYLQLMNGDGLMGKRSREEAVASCSRALKSLAKELGVPVVAGAQLSRPDKKSKPSRPQLTDLRESGSLEQDADVVIFIHRPEYYLGDSTPEADRGIAELIVAKQRSGPTGIRRARWWGRYTFFEDANES